LSIHDGGAGAIDAPVIAAAVRTEDGANAAGAGRVETIADSCGSAFDRAGPGLVAVAVAAGPVALGAVAGAACSACSRRCAATRSAAGSLMIAAGCSACAVARSAAAAPAGGALSSGAACMPMTVSCKCSGGDFAWS